MSAILEILGVLVIAVLGFLGLMKIVYSMRARKDIWIFYKKLSKKLGLELREGHGGNYGMPDLYGKINDRKVYVHPVRGKKKAPPKTVYAAEIDLKLDEKVIISSPETSEVEEDLPKVEIPQLERYDLEAFTESQRDRSSVKKLITKKAASKLNGLLKKNGDMFRALIIESGLVMFSTYGIDMDEQKLKYNLGEVEKLAIIFEESEEEGPRKVKNERLEAIEKKSRLVYMEFGFMSLLTVLGLYLVYTSIFGLSFFFINMGIVLFMIAGARMVSILNTRGWLRSGD
ncbi:MAG: hypothetical protein ACOCT7_00680 [Candidatus Saliniplasma sp.]